MEYEVVDTLGGNIIVVYETRDDALYAIRLYCVQRMMSRVSLIDQDFIVLVDNGDHVIYDNPIGYFPTKPKFLINEI